MSDDFAVDPQASEAGLPEAWRDHVRELRAENARRRKENQELRAELADLTTRARDAETAQAAATQGAARETARLAAVHRRLKELSLGRTVRETLEGAVARKTAGEGSTAVVDLGRVQRLLERLPVPVVDPDRDMVVDDEAQVVLEPAAGERLKGLVEELVDFASVDQRVAPPPVGGEPPRPAEPGAGRVANAWDPEGQTTPAGRARASLRKAAAAHATVLDELV